MIPFWVLAAGHSHDEQEVLPTSAPTPALMAVFAVAAAGFGSVMANRRDVA